MISLFGRYNTGRCIYSSCAPSTGFNPRWDCTLSFQLQVPDLALVRFVVEDHDHTARNDFVGQFTLPFTSLRTGAHKETHRYRLQNTHQRGLLFVMPVLFFLRVSTCSFIEGRWFQSVPCHTLHPCQSDPQRSPHQNCVRANGRGQTQGVTRIWTRWKAAFSDNKRLWKRRSECEQKERDYCRCQPVVHFRPQVVEFTMSHFSVQEERCRLSEMKTLLANEMPCAGWWIHDALREYLVLSVLRGSGNRALGTVVPATHW